MASTIIDIYNNLIKYDNKEIIIIIDDSGEPWFSGSDIGILLGYSNTRKAIIDHVSKNHKKELKKIISEEKEKIPNAQPNAIFINEAGLYELVVGSKKKEAENFKAWLYEEVLPTIRKTGTYKIAKKYIKALENITEKLKKNKKRVKILEGNQKKEKFPEGSYIYVIRPFGIDKKLLKAGISTKLLPRINTYNTSVPDNVEILYKIKVKSPIPIEYCMKALLYEYRYRNNKEYYKCSLKKMIEIIIKCEKIINDDIYCNVCNKKISEISRHISEDKTIDIEDDDSLYGIICEINVDENDDEDDDDEDENEEEEDSEEIQDGGIKMENKYKYKYKKYKIKYLNTKLRLLLY